MGVCVSKTGHPAEDFIRDILSHLKLLKTKTYSQLMEQIKQTFHDGLANQNDANELFKTYFEQDIQINRFSNYHNRIFSNLLEKIFKSTNEGLDKISAYYLLLILIPFSKKPEAELDSLSRKQRLDNILDVIRKINGNSSVNYKFLKSKLAFYLELLTITITKAVMDEALKSNVKTELYDQIKNLFNKVYSEQNLDDYLNSNLRDFETKYSVRLNNSEITSADMNEIFDKRISFFYTEELRYEIVYNYALV